MTHAVYLEKLKQSVLEFITDFSEQEALTALADFLPLFQMQKLNKSEFFIQAGDHAAHLAFIGQGVMRAFHTSPEGNEYTKTIFQEGQFVAPLAALTTGDVSPISLQALTPMELLVADYSMLNRLYRRHHCLEHMGRSVIQWEWVKKEIREIRLVTLSAEERYDIFLKEHTGLEHRIPWYYIASHLGITPVALSRIRARKKKRD
ncbi:MAG: Crp/Fnr family transcriptional regulator [Leptospiraceae bacterium]|nr:Crp/Fnr family transcriptional regulator [Leptospiraceae bacterium]MCB1322252.1 Crp/Fnr family transcriptional regulator [Leptospiraceae bacterium]